MKNKLRKYVKIQPHRHVEGLYNVFLKVENHQFAIRYECQKGESKFYRAMLCKVLKKIIKENAR